MKMIALNLCVASLALGPLAVGAWAAAAQGGDTPSKPIPAASAEQTIHLCKLGDIKDLDLKAEGEKKNVGEIDGLVLDAANGRIRYALVAKGGVLEIGETEHLVPWESIRVTPKNPGAKDKDEGVVARTSLTVEQIKSAPVYKKGETMIDAALDQRIRENAGLKAEINAGPAPRYVSTLELKGAEVRSPADKEIGKIEEMVIAPEDAMVAYNVLATGGVLGLGEKRFALPWQVTEISYDKDKKVVVRAPLTKETLQNAPEYDGKDWKRMSSPDWIRDMCTHYSKQPFWMQSWRASAEKRTSGSGG